MHRIFIVDDEPKLARILEAHLTRFGYDVATASRFDDLKNEFLESGADLVLLDVNLPWFDGFHWCRQIRTVSTAPIIFISARGGEMDQVMAIEGGGDDYIVKPFNLEVVTARIRSVLRRAYGEYAPQSGGDDSHEWRGLRWDPGRLRIEYCGREADVSRNECLLLEALVRAEGRVVGRGRLVELLWDETTFIDDNTLTVNVTRLRRRLAAIGLRNAIRTARGEGYLLEIAEDS